MSSDYFLRHSQVETAWNFYYTSLNWFSWTYIAFFMHLDQPKTKSSSSTNILALVFVGFVVLIVVCLALVCLCKSNQEASVPLSPTELVVTQSEPNGVCVDERNYNHEDIEKRPPEKG